jgi:uncharacterized repeat protein (TIGR01451 family)
LKVQHSSRLAHHAVIFGFFALSILLLVICERPSKADLLAHVKRAAARDASGTLDDPQLTLDKRHEPNSSATTWQLGVPITYVITLSNSGAPSSNISVTDTLPPGFIFINGTCTATFGATCQNPTLPPPTGGVLTVPALAIPFDGHIEIRITGYFKTSGPKINTAVASAGSLPVGNAIRLRIRLTCPPTRCPPTLRSKSP